MPTPNDYSRVIYSGSDSSGRQEATAKEYGQVDPTDTATMQDGNFPLTYSTNMGENYPSQAEVYSKVDTCRNSDEGSYKSRSSQGKTGEFGQCTPGDFGPYPPKDDMLPDPVPSKQFSKDKNGDPKALLNSTRECITDHADLNAQYGLTQPVATLGSHPWLRDELTNTGDREAGNTTPDENCRVPKRRNV